MKKIIILLVMVWVTIPAEAQLALKGGISYAQSEAKTVALTAQYTQGLLVVSSDIFIPTIKTEKVSAAGRVGIGFGGDIIKVVGDGVIRYEDKIFRCGYGAEVNLTLIEPVGIFARWSMTYPIMENGGYPQVLWKCGRNELTFGILANLDWGFY